MLQKFKSDLSTYHKLFTGDRCGGWELEELLANAIKSDTTTNDHVIWTEAGHDDNADIVVKRNDTKYPIQIKSGRISNDKLVLSGHRLGRFKGNMAEISDYINSRKANIISVPYKKIDDEKGRRHIYRLCYIPIEYLQGVSGKDWKKEPNRSTYKATNKHGVQFSISPSMSWQIWWRIPTSILYLEEEFDAGMSG